MTEVGWSSASGCPMRDLDPADALDAILGSTSDVTAKASEFARALDLGDVTERDASCEFAPDAWRQCAEFGVQGLNIPVAYGGTHAQPLTALLTFEGLGSGCRDHGLVYALGSQVWSIQDALVRFGSDDQRTKYLPDLAAGRSIGAFAMTEAEVGSDPAAISTTARRVDGGYRLDGTKTFITLAPVADVALVFASTDTVRGRWGITAFLVDLDQPTVRRSVNRPKTGMRTTPFGDLTFHDCHVPVEMRLGPEGAGFSIFTAATETERSNIWAGQLGVMHRQLESCIQFASTRRIAGKSIGDHQAVAHRVVDMKLRYETSRLLMYKAAIARARGEQSTLLASLAKLHAAESAVASGLDAVRLFGARGYVVEFEVERDLRDAIGGLTYSGTSEVQRNVVARLLGLGRRMTTRTGESQ